MWTIKTIFFLALLSCSLFALGLWLNAQSKDPHDFDDAVLENMRNDQGLLCNWKGLTPFEQKMRLALYQQHARDQVAEEQKRA